jgi:hypothetical protein
MIVHTFPAVPGHPFASSQAAEEWCVDNDYIIGFMASGSPRAIYKAEGVSVVYKWHNLNAREQEHADGRLLYSAEGPRDGSCTIYIRQGASEIFPRVVG